jgi:Flp pilus assembly protein TadG
MNKVLRFSGLAADAPGVMGKLMHRRRVEGDRGAALIEAAFVIPLLLLLLFGVIEFGVLLNNRSVVTATTAAGARTGSTQGRITDSGIAWPAITQNPDDLLYNTFDATVGALSARTNMTPQRIVIYRAHRSTGNPCNSAVRSACTSSISTNFANCPNGQCWVFTYDGSGDPTSRSNWVSAGKSWPFANRMACGDTSRTDFIGVEVTATSNALTGTFGSGWDLRERTVMRFEPLTSNDSTGCIS